MKKEEALNIVPDVSRVLMEYINSILLDNLVTTGTISISYIKSENFKNCTIEIDVSNSSRKFIKKIDTKITTDHVDVLTSQIFDDFIDWFLEKEDMGVSRYYEIKGMIGMNMSGVNAVNSIGSRININFLCKGNEFEKQAELYNRRLDDYVKKNGEGLYKK